MVDQPVRKLYRLRLTNLKTEFFNRHEQPRRTSSIRRAILWGAGRWGIRNSVAKNVPSSRSNVRRTGGCVTAPSQATNSVLGKEVGYERALGARPNGECCTSPDGVLCRVIT